MKQGVLGRASSADHTGVVANTAGRPEGRCSLWQPMGMGLKKDDDDDE